MKSTKKSKTKGKAKVKRNVKKKVKVIPADDISRREEIEEDVAALVAAETDESALEADITTMKSKYIKSDEHCRECGCRLRRKNDYGICAPCGDRLWRTLK